MLFFDPINHIYKNKNASGPDSECNKTDPKKEEDEQEEEVITSLQ